MPFAEKASPFKLVTREEYAGDIGSALHSTELKMGKWVTVRQLVQPIEDAPNYAIDRLGVVFVAVPNESQTILHHLPVNMDAHAGFWEDDKLPQEHKNTRFSKVFGWCYHYALKANGELFHTFNNSGEARCIEGYILDPFAKY